MNVEIVDERILKTKTLILETLDLANFSLCEIPPSVRDLVWLKRINLSGNEISELPDWIGELENLEVFDARNNKLKSLHPNFERLQKLETIYLRENEFEEIPFEIFKLKNLKSASFTKNKITRIPADFFEIENVNIDDNPVIDPPIEVYNRGYDALKNYFAERATGIENLYEAKLLIVGEPGAGKTSLMNKILDENYTLTLHESSTKGIKINPFYFYTNDRIKFRVNIWDFGGQEIYHTTHQFFLTKRSLYILLSDNRAEDTDFNYWLQSIELLSGNSPLLIAQNEKHDRKLNINEAGMRERFRNIRRIFSFNLAKDKNSLRSLVREIEHQIVNLPHIGTELPKIWVAIRNELEIKSQTRPYISEVEYFEICASFGMTEKERAWFLSDYFHDLGVFLHFRDHAVLKRWIILKPDWGTEAVYKVLDNAVVIENNGYFTKKDLKIIWSELRYRDMHDELISLMMKFELCYQLDDGKTFIAAQLLKREKPLYGWIEKDNINFKYDYDFMPKGIITRFIVRMNDYILNEKTVWREGVVLFRANTSAEIIETYGKREIKIRVQGENKKEFLAIILDSIDKINLTYSNLKVKKLIPCNCNKCKASGIGYYFEYNVLKKFIANGIQEDRCQESLTMVKILPLIDDILGKGERSASGLDIFVSYHDKDVVYKREIVKHLSVLEKTNKISIVDKSLLPVGENEKMFIRDKLDTSRVILCLLSPDYIDEDVCYNEMVKAYERSETETCLFIPVILRDCDFTSLPFSKIKPVLFNGKPIFSEKELVDTALHDAATQIKEAIEHYRSNPII